MHAPSPSLNTRRAMHGGNKLQIGLFGANCSSGRAVTLVPERWSGSWPDNKKLGLMADQAGIDFLLPIGRWKGYGGTTDYQGTTLETVTWASALLASTKRITVFGTVHAPIFNPVVAAKYLNMKGIRGKPKPYGGTRPLIMNAGASATGQAFAVKNCDAFFLQASRTSLDETAQKVATAKGQARQR